MYKVLVTCFFIFSFFCVKAQDTIERTLPFDSLAEDMGYSGNSERYMDDRHYDRIPYVDSVYQVDSGYFEQTARTFSTREFDYDKTNITETGYLKTLRSKISAWISNLFPKQGFGEFSELFYYLLSAIGLAFLIWIIYRVIFTNRRLLVKDKKEQGEQSEVKFIEKNLMKIDLIPYIDSAKKEQDYARAVRYLNLLNVQLLAQNDIVRWKYTKTNSEFILEIQDELQKKEFVRNVNIFNRVWYGGVEISREEFEEYADYFFNFQRKWR